MSSKLSIEVLQMILENIDKADLATVCQVNRICCACAQDVLYCNITILSYSHPMGPSHSDIDINDHLARRGCEEDH